MIRIDQYCEHCDYPTSDPLHFARHMKSARHLMNSGQIEYMPRKSPITRQLGDDGAKELKIKTGSIAIIPNIEKDQTDSLFVAGPRGCGKSRFCAEYIGDYQTKFPHNRFVLFSNKAKDEPLDKLKPIRVPLIKKIVDKPYKLNDFKNSVILFDDIDGIADKEIKKEVFRLYDTMLKDGRSLNITPIITYHQVTDYKNTREMLNNCNYCVIFPGSGATAQNTLMLKTYCGLSKKQVSKILKLDSRAVIIKKTSPMTIIYEKGIYLL